MSAEGVGALAPGAPLAPGHARRELVRTSFAILFFELICIRWIPGEVRFIGYFMNFILLASFLGVGLGILSAKRRFPLPPFALMLLGLVLLVALSEFDIHFFSPQVLYYGAGEKTGAQESFLVLPLIFVAVTLTFIPLARPLAALLKALPPLQAYTWDIVGSLTGIAAFFVMSALQLPPWCWFAVLALVLLPTTNLKRLALLAPLYIAVIVVAWSQDSRNGSEDRWSPYYRVMTLKNEFGGYDINVNHAGHQRIQPHMGKESFYFRAYDVFGQGAFDKVLILGAGSGSDVQIALTNGALHVHGVEIDPVIQSIGRELHPEKPFSDKRVTLSIDDGRAFLRHSTEKFDLIIYALPDSLTLTSGFASLRLESFLLTTDSFRAAREHLSEHGLFVAYNYYRFDWLVQKLAGMVEQAFGHAPYVTTYGAWGRAAVLMAGPRLEEHTPPLSAPYAEGGLDNVPQRGMHLPMIGAGRMHGSADFVPATDDWPFVYMPAPTIPSIYLGALAMVLGIALVLLFLLGPRAEGPHNAPRPWSRRLPQLASLRRFDWHMFCLGAAFMLLETRSLVTFGLLFGTTWMVNSLVFFAILASVLLAIRLNQRFAIRRIGLWYLALFALLGVNYLVPVDALSGIDSAALRYVLASTLTFAPIFIANVVFSRAFRDTSSADTAFGANLLGVMFGGMFEYLALMTGYQALVLVVIGFYAIAYVAGTLATRRAARAT